MFKVLNPVNIYTKLIVKYNAFRIVFCGNAMKILMSLRVCNLIVLFML